VRWEVAQRAEGNLLHDLAQDPEPDGAAEAARRLAAPRSAPDEVRDA
jgi:hypothetical protein